MLGRRLHHEWRFRFAISRNRLLRAGTLDCHTQSLAASASADRYRKCRPVRNVICNLSFVIRCARCLAQDVVDTVLPMF
jgi:hypothetical protein